MKLNAGKAILRVSCY